MTEFVVTKKDIVEVAGRILANEMDPLEGCRWIVRHQQLLSAEERHDADFLTLVGIESETDTFAMGAVRERWSPEALAEQDRYREEYLARVRRDLLDACSAIIAKLSHPS
jgi:hypothetical protein